MNRDRRDTQKHGDKADRRDRHHSCSKERELRETKKHVNYL